MNKRNNITIAPLFGFGDIVKDLIDDELFEVEAIEREVERAPDGTITSISWNYGWTTTGVLIEEKHLRLIKKAMV